MTYADELAVVGTMACSPGEAIPYAWASLHADDFEDETHRWVFEQLVAVWHLAKGDVSHGPHFWELLAIGFSRHFKEDENWGFGAIGELQSASFGDPVFRWHVERLVNDSLLRRLRGVLHNWTMYLTEIQLYDVWENGVHRKALLGDNIPPESARGAIAAMLRDMRRELRRSPEAPRCAEEKVTPKAEVGVW